MQTFYRVYFGVGETFNEFITLAAAEQWREVNASGAQVQTVQRAVEQPDPQA